MKHTDIQEIVHRYYKNIIMLAFTYTKSMEDAEDVAQDVFLELLEKKKSFESEEHRKAWLIRVAINKSKNMMNSFWKKKRSELQEVCGSMEEADLDLIRAVFSLKPGYRIPIHLFYYEGYSIHEIAELLHEKDSTICTRLERGRQQLKKILGSDYYE